MKTTKTMSLKDARNKGYNCQALRDEIARRGEDALCEIGRTGSGAVVLKSCGVTIERVTGEALKIEEKIVVWSDLIEMEERGPAFRFALVRTDLDRLYVTGTTRTREEAERDLASFRVKFPSSDMDLKIVDRQGDLRFAEALNIDKWERFAARAGIL